MYFDFDSEVGDWMAVMGMGGWYKRMFVSE